MVCNCIFCSFVNLIFSNFASGFPINLPFPPLRWFYGLELGFCLLRLFHNSMMDWIQKKIERKKNQGTRDLMA